MTVPAPLVHPAGWSCHGGGDFGHAQRPPTVQIERTKGWVDGLDLAGWTSAIFPGSVGYVRPLGVFGNGIHHAVGLALVVPDFARHELALDDTKLAGDATTSGASAGTDPVDRAWLGRLLRPPALRGRFSAGRYWSSSGPSPRSLSSGPLTAQPGRAYSYVAPRVSGGSSRNVGRRPVPGERQDVDWV